MADPTWEEHCDEQAIDALAQAAGPIAQASWSAIRERLHRLTDEIERLRRVEAAAIALAREVTYIERAEVSYAASGCCDRLREFNDALGPRAALRGES